MENKPVLPGWKTEQMLCRDKTGASYVIRRGQDNKKEIAVLKVVSIAYGNSKDSGQNKEFLNEVAAACMDNQNINFAGILRYEDVRYALHQDGREL